MSSMFLPIFSFSLRDFRLGGFGNLDVFRTGYFRLVFELTFQICNNSCTTLFSKEYLSYFLLLTINMLENWHIFICYK